ncbi:hypothetical protein H7I77_00120 [Mycolicibacterium novocastrense]|uniref:Uncharacterized protein n=1 Tax=Mycolicibacterium novocastrense TaxID=59813 RepID=A0AAW5SE49_MYCNV|nr:hypothetical protein [Mycolicibacterium novocastrense]MCV7021766.1 hypothetical protein [Mycolicibacterium novocastrense]
MNDELGQANSRGFELGRRHAAIAEVVGQAAQWARSFCVVTSHVLPDGSAFVTYPLALHADRLHAVWTRLGGACMDLATSLAAGEGIQSASAMPPNHGNTGQPTTYREGADYVHVLQPRRVQRPTLQDLWRTEVTHALLYLSVSGIRTDELERYASTSQALFDDAAAVVRDAYARSTAATFGRVWALASDVDGRGRALIAWMKALADVGFSADDCALILSDFKVVSPDAVSYCLDNKSVWLSGE